MEELRKEKNPAKRKGRGKKGHNKSRVPAISEKRGNDRWMVLKGWIESDHKGVRTKPHGVQSPTSMEYE